MFFLNFSLITDWLCDFFGKWVSAKNARVDVGEIDPTCQFHQRFLRTFFVRTSFFLVSFGFGAQISYKKRARKMLMKLTAGECFRQCQQMSHLGECHMKHLKVS
jgi:hypothetical protein